jgi:hypothetical protein
MSLSVISTSIFHKNTTSSSVIYVCCVWKVVKHLLSFAHSAKRFENDNVKFGFWGVLCKNLHMW